jgi:two-component system, OmpR family, phosphate regulon sensor histidine kinase PhoR
MSNKRLIITSIIIFIATFLVIFITTLVGFTSIEKGIYSSAENQTNSLVVSLNCGLTERDALATYGVNKDTYLSFYHEDEDKPYLTNVSVTSEKTFAELEANKGKFIIYDSKDIGTKVCEGFAYANGTKSYVRFDLVVPSTYYVSRAFMIHGTITVVVLTLAGEAIFWYSYKKSLRPLKTQIRKLQNLISKDHSVDHDDDLSSLALMIHDSRKELENQLNLTKTGEQKIDFILDSISQGLLVLDASYKIVMINQTAADIFQVKKEDVENKNMDDIHPSHPFEVNASMVIQTNHSLSYTETIRGRVYQCSINPISYSWTRINERNGASILFIDITDEYNGAKMKREFFDNASHELKSPLTGILGYQQMMKAGIITSKEDIDNAIDKSIKECNRMNKIIMNMLSLSSLENKELRSVEEIDVSEATSSIAESLTPQLKEKHIDLSMKKGTLKIKINPDDFDRLVRNLIDNAIKYNKDNGSIKITVDDTERSFTIKDTGVGISPENQSRIFERFFRVDKARSRENGGTGLGLAIVKHVCNYYGYKLTLKSALNKGTEFKIVFSEDE